MSKSVTKIHLDTDIGGDIDDLCALAFLLRTPDVEITGITTTAEKGGKRAGYANYAVSLEKRIIPIKAGADVSGAHYRYQMDLPRESRYWPQPIQALQTPVHEAIDLLKHSIDSGATIIGIGPFTNLFLLDLEYPGILRQANLVLMGGHIFPTRSGFPRWGNEYDFNIQADIRSATHVIENSNPTMVPLTVTVETALRKVHLPGLRQAGELGNLIAKQAEEFAIEYENEKAFADCDLVPDDIINFQHDPLACAVALGEADVEIEELPIKLDEQDGWLVERVDPDGEPTRVVTKVNGPSFNQFWLDRVCAKQ
jgi:purine nucleosidase